MNSKLMMFAMYLAASPVVGAGPAQAPAENTALDPIVEQHMKDAGMVGVGAVILVDRKVVWMKGYGFADRARGQAFTPDTVMNIGSISKTFTGVALMQTVEEGKLDLDEDINRYLPFRVTNPHFPDEPITLRQIATHTSGISDRWEVYEGTYHYDGDKPEPLGEFLRDYFLPDGKHYSSENFLPVKPGTHREYSNIAAGLAGYIVERAVGEPLQRYAQRRIFAPLGMHGTGWSLADVDPARHARLYVAQEGMAIPILLYEGTTYPDGGVRTSVADLAKFFVALLNEGEYDGRRILKPEAVAEMLRFHYAGENMPDNVAPNEKNSGIFWSTKMDVTRIGHGGSDPGLKTEMLADLSGDIGVILFTNTSLDGEAMRSYFGIFNALWKHAETLKQQRQVTAR